MGSLKEVSVVDEEGECGLEVTFSRENGLENKSKESGEEVGAYSVVSPEDSVEVSFSLFIKDALVCRSTN